MARNDPQINLRIPETLKAALDAAAAETGRSLTAEVVQRLVDSFNHQMSDRHVVISAPVTPVLTMTVSIPKDSFDPESLNDFAGVFQSIAVRSADVPPAVPSDKPVELTEPLDENSLGIRLVRKVRAPKK